MQRIKEVKLSSIISPPFRLNELIDDNVKQIADSIKIVGQLAPVGLKSDGTLIYGLHRVKAVESLGYETVSAIVYDELDPLDSRLMEIDENINRKGMDNIKIGELLIERKEILKKKNELAQQCDNQYSSGKRSGATATDHSSKADAKQNTSNTSNDDNTTEDAEPQKKTIADLAREAGSAQSNAMNKKLGNNVSGSKPTQAFLTNTVESTGLDRTTIARDIRIGNIPQEVKDQSFYDDLNKKEKLQLASNLVKEEKKSRVEETQTDDYIQRAINKTLTAKYENKKSITITLTGILAESVQDMAHKRRVEPELIVKELLNRALKGVNA